MNQINNNLLPSIIYILKLLGLFVDSDCTTKWKTHILKFTILCMIYSNVGMAIHLIENINNTPVLFKGLVYEVPFIVYLLIAFNFIFKREKHYNLLMKLQNIIDFGTSKNFKINGHLNVEIVIKLAVKVVTAFLGISIIILISSPLMKVFYKYLMGTLTLDDWSYPVEMNFCNTDESTIIFFINYLIFTIAFIACGGFAFSVAFLYFGVSFHLVIAYKNVQFMLLETDKTITTSKNNLNIQKNDIEFKKSIQTCIEFHNELIEFQNELEDINSEVIFGNMFAFLSIICCTALQLTKWRMITYDDLIMNASEYLISYGFLFCFAFISDMITNEGLNVATTAYNCRWDERTPNQRKYYLLIIQIAQRPRYMRGLYYFPCTLETFLKAVKASFSILTIMQTLEDNN